MSISLRNYTLKYLVSAFLIIIAVWAALFYTFLREEIYDNIDDGLKNLKIQIIREAYVNDNALKVSEFDFNQYRITSIEMQQYKEGNFFRNELFYMEYEEDYEPYRVLETYFMDKEGFPKRLEIRTSMVEEGEFVQNLLFALLILYAVIVASIVIINNVMLRKTWKPFYQILTNLRKYQFGKEYQQENTATDIHEFRLLKNEIERMIDRNQQAFQNQKQFIENASHELQTPLAVAINKIEILMEDENLGEEKLVELNNIKQTLLRLVTLNKSLLTLSRIENNQYLERESVNFSQVIRKIWEDFSDMMAFKEIRSEIVEKESFITEINPNLAYILVSNLLRNAIKYNKNGGFIQFEIFANGFSLQNTSVQAKSLDKNLIFNRFYKSNQDSTSTGLGLSIVKTIIDTTPNLSIEYSYQNGLHKFMVRERGIS
ncbi:MAG: HAMP domain-containing sensor histidine kinase [Capnocytophaga sp.]|nr:HAMP domain-containing sensor histidine kinase [Capnocytophaga sp.]